VICNDMGTSLDSREASNSLILPESREWRNRRGGRQAARKAGLPWSAGGRYQWIVSLHEDLSEERYSRFADLTGRVVAVMGGTSGLGRAIALGLARAGADVAVTGRREALVAEVAREVEALGRRTLRVACDVRERASIDAFRDAVLAEFGAVHVLVNAAGIMARQVAAEAPEQEWQSILDINVNGAMRACQSFYEPLKACGSGRICQHRLADVLRGLQSRHCLRRFEERRAGHDAPTGRGMGARRHFGERHRAGRLRHRPESSHAGGHRARARAEKRARRCIVSAWLKN